ncbi:MAG: AGE family epimerase/isomerase [Elusimicrobia bacterium]|nr:AGE family epimerase/isomerase [Elusimicrobiota bacterium]
MESSTPFPAPEESIARARRWLSADVFPLWLSRGVEPGDGGFVEALSPAGAPLSLSRRAMVQARQIFSLRTGRDMGCLPAAEAETAIARAGAFLADRYALPSGAFAYALGVDGRPTAERVDLYTQAFALFGLANAYAVTRDEKLKTRAVALAEYVRRERRAPGGGYTEFEDGRAVLRSNPHMHLFEAALEWMKVAPDARWAELAGEILTLCLDRFVDPETKALGEIFSDDGALVRTGGKFFFEPGHQYEWAWLMILYEELTGRDLSAVREGLFSAAERHGIDPAGYALDEIWSDGTPKKRSARFWPQTERIKAAVRSAALAPAARQAEFDRAADQGVAALFTFLRTPTPGLWWDTRLETGDFRQDPAKASSLYHIINAFSEYAAYRVVSRPKGAR